MNTNYDCVAIWVGKARRNLLLEILEEQYDVKLIGHSHTSCTCLYYYKNRPTELFWSDSERDIGELAERMDNKCFKGEIETYTIIDYPRFMKEIRDEMY